MLVTGQNKIKIHIVIGPPGSGKSTFITEHFPHLDCIDLRDFQKDIDIPTYKNVLESYVRHRRACINKAKEGCDFVVEHTLMKAKRRVYYVNRLKRFGSLICWYTDNGGHNGEHAWDFFEVPEVSEGFKEVAIIKREGDDE